MGENICRYGYGEKDKQLIPKKYSAEAQDLIRGLLEANPSTRYKSAEKIRNHPWFNGFDWELLDTGRYTAPWVPNSVPVIVGCRAKLKCTLKQNHMILDAGTILNVAKIISDGQRTICSGWN